MRSIITIVLLVKSIFLFSQELETDSAWIESEVKILYAEAEQITNVLYNYLELDYWLENLDTLSDANKVKIGIYKEQRDNLLTTALNYYEEITTKYVTSKLYHRALNNQGIIEFELKLYERAKKSFLEILNSNVDDKEEVQVGFGLMAEPYANYRNRAAEMLYEIEYSQGNYNEAKKYLEESTKHQYHHWCSNAFEEKEFWLAFQRSKIESKFENYVKATKMIIPHLFNRRIMKEEELREYTVNLLFHMKTKDELLQEFEIGINNFYKRRIEPESDYENYFIRFLGEEIEISIYGSSDKEDELKQIKEHVEFQWLYNHIKSKK
jgi:tetratricopeptide (TPR) repeat protein